MPESAAVSSSPLMWVDKWEAARRLELSWRRVLELAKKGAIRSKRGRDPSSGQPMVLFYADSLEEYKDAQAERRTEGRQRGPVLTAGQIRQLVAIVSGIFREMTEHGVSIGPRPWLTLAEAEKYCGLSRSLLLTMIQRGELHALRDCPSDEGDETSVFRVKRTDLDAIQAAPQ